MGRKKDKIKHRGKDIVEIKKGKWNLGKCINQQRELKEEETITKE